MLWHKTDENFTYPTTFAMKSALKNLAFNLSRPKIVARVSCFGSRIISKFQPLYFYNNQKYRITDVLKDTQHSIFKSNRKTLEKIVYAQNHLYLTNPSLKPNLIILESYSDLTDSMFTSQNGERFLCHLSDFKPTLWPKIANNESVNPLFVNHGLCDLSSYEDDLQQFVTLINTIYDQSNIFFINTPIKVEKRKAIKERAEVIQSAAQAIAHKSSNFYNLTIPDSVIEKLYDGCLPYHFADKTVHFCFDKITSILS